MIKKIKILIMKHKFVVVYRCFSTDNSVKVNPIICYSNANLDKYKILEDNKNKGGIYRWVNNINNKSYIGSSIDLRLRMYKYYSPSALLNTEIYKNKIYNALRKYGFSNFSLEILEYCDDKSLIIEREQYYIDLLKPEYNILALAGSSLGFKHDSVTLAFF